MIEQNNLFQSNTTKEIPKIFMIKKLKKSNLWSKQEDELLLNISKNYVNKNWLEISKSIEKKNPAQCSNRYLKIKPGIKKGNWLSEEDNLIKQNVKNLGKKWSQISKLMVNRTGKQIRDRYLNYLDSNFKKERFSFEEDEKIKELYIKYGAKWTRISQHVLERTPDMIKNRFYSYLKSKIHVYERRKSTFNRLWIKKNKIKKIKNGKNVVKNESNSILNKTDGSIIEEKKIEKIKFFNNENLKISQENNFEKIKIFKKSYRKLYACNVDQFTFFARPKSNGNLFEKYFENPTNLIRFTYFYLENSKNLLKNNFNSNNSYF